ncbi:uncharacterized protein LOC124418927 isoform X2 [Lucilia cuprina]|uniref:uncharacterized protein LOC124418927 isoform X2 n=1 Tax=Lucilia cuprina TaxID=7375 RepID=UPI001F0525A4|nr:uncharacterized protein LOC124418927 isoform X2 [Lucilia cuprina]
MEFSSPPPFLSEEIIQMFDEDLIPIKSPSEYAFKEADHECLANSTNEVRFLTSISPNVDIRYEELEEESLHPLQRKGGKILNHGNVTYEKSSENRERITLT